MLELMRGTSVLLVYAWSEVEKKRTFYDTNFLGLGGGVEE
jgi:hypothetical protein